jgi:hypothetical protein
MACFPFAARWATRCGSRSPTHSSATATKQLNACARHTEPITGETRVLGVRAPLLSHILFAYKRATPHMRRRTLRIARLPGALRSMVAAFLAVGDAARVATVSATGAALAAASATRASPGLEIESARWYVGGLPEPPARSTPSAHAYRHRRRNGAAQCGLRYSPRPRCSNRST